MSKKKKERDAEAKRDRDQRFEWQPGDVTYTPPEQPLLPAKPR